MSVELFRLTDAKQMGMPSVRAFVRQALATDKLILDVDAAMAELEQALAQPTLAVIVGHEDEQWAGFVMLQASYSAFNPACVVVHFYNLGGTPMRKALVEAVGAFADRAGLPRIVGVDTNDHPEAFARLFSAAGAPEMTGRMVVFNRKEGLL